MCGLSLLVLHSEFLKLRNRLSPTQLARAADAKLKVTYKVGNFHSQTDNGLLFSLHLDAFHAMRSLERSTRLAALAGGFSIS